MSTGPLNVIQISDLHLFKDPQKSLLGVKTEDSFQAVLSLLKQKVKEIDLIILSGDLSQDGSPEAYKRIADQLDDFNAPIYCIPGNHDDADKMLTVYPYKKISNEHHIIRKNWQFILLNSQKKGAVEGYLDADQLKYLQHSLESHPDHHAAVVFHHQPIPIASEWLDNLGLKNAKEFWEVLSRYPNVKTVLFGHIHQQFENQIHGVNCYSAPSTCFQFMRKQNHFGLEHLPPGFRWVKCYDDGTLKTAVERADKYIGDFDTNAKGY